MAQAGMDNGPEGLFPLFHEEPDCKFFKFGLHNLPLGVPGWDFTFWLNCRLKITPCDEMLSGHVGSVQAGPLIGGLQ
jgi:hypothetical protein